MKKIKILLLILILTLAAGGIFLLIFGIPIWPLIYWWILLLVVFAVWNFRLGSGFILWGGFLLFIFSALITSVGIKGIGETLMRVVFLAWIIGLIQAVGELKINSKKS